MGMVIGLVTTSAMGATIAAAVGFDPVAGAVALDSVAVVTSAMGGLAPAGALRAGLYPEVWTGELVKAFRESDKSVAWYSRIPSYDQYVEKDTIHLVDIGADPEVLINNTTYPLEVKTLEDGDIAISLDKFQTTPIRVSDDELHAICYDKMSSVIERTKAAVKSTRYRRAIHSIAPAEKSAKTPIIQTTGAEYNGRKMLTTADIVSLKEAFDLADVPDDGRILVLCAEHVSDLLRTDQRFANQYYNYKSGMILDMMGFEVYQYNRCPYYNADTLKKISYGAVPGENDLRCSVAFSTERTMRADGSTKPYLDEPTATTQESLFSMRTYNICLPKKAEGLGAIVSAPKA